MFDNSDRTEIAAMGEFGLIQHLSQHFEAKNSKTIKGIGDDCAVLDCGDHFGLLTTDLLLEGVHFDLSFHPLKHLGYKAISVAVSDVYAMNGVAEQVTVGLGLSNRFSLEAVEELYAGMQIACEHYGVDLVGGDTTTSQSGLVISMSAFGRVTKDKIVYRGGAKPGDLLFFNRGKKIIHVGILYAPGLVIHSSGKVRIDVLTEKGIFNAETKKQSHQLCLIKRVANFN